MRELFRDGDWALNQENDDECFVDEWIVRPGQIWEHIPHFTNTVITHNCHGEEWKWKYTYNRTKNHVCGNCGENVPEELIGLKSMVDWNK